MSYQTKPTRKIDFFKLKMNMEKDQRIQKYNIWMNLPKEQKNKIWFEWNKYHEDVWNTESAHIFIEQKAAYIKGDFGKVKELSEKAKKILEEGNFIKKPSSIDPIEFYTAQLYYDYKQVLKECNQIQDTPEGEASSLFYGKNL